MTPYMIFLSDCLSLTCDMVINDSIVTGVYYDSLEECQKALPEVLKIYKDANPNLKLHYYGECSDKILNLKDAGMET